jgi:hypothetical protein
MSLSVLAGLEPLKKVALAGIVGVIAFFAGWGVNYFYYSDKTPVQPINFSHVIHATDNKIPCMFCHIYARRSITSGVPSVNKCINCHKAIVPDKPEIKKLFGYWERKEPIPWIKVHDLPDFVYFPHKRHVKADVKCQTCHGPVETMARVTRLAPLKMGWCLNCHKERKVKNGYDCWTCHK